MNCLNSEHLSLPSSKMCLNCRTKKNNNYSFTVDGNFCSTVGLLGTDSGQLYIRRKTPSPAVDNIPHEIDYGLEFCWLSVSLSQQLIAVITAAVLRLFGRCAWRHSGLRSWWSISRMRTATLILWYVCMYPNTNTHSLMDYWSHCNPLKIRHYSLNKRWRLCLWSPWWTLFLSKWSKCELCFLCMCAGS